MSNVLIVGDGPGGLSAALFLARGGHAVTVFGTDDTAMHYAHLNNYLGAPDTPGSELQTISLKQAEGAGASIERRRVTALEAGDRIAVTTEDGERLEGDYLILSEGRKPELAESLGVEMNEGAVVVDRDQRTSVDRVYSVGRSTRPKRSQAIISAGAGAIAALDILAREVGSDVQDWDKAESDA